MKRLMKQAANTNEEVINIGKAILENSESESIRTDFVEGWLEYNLENDDNLDEKVIYDKFSKEVQNKPDELFEKLIDLVPEEGDDDKLYNADSTEKNRVVEMLLEGNYESIIKIITQTIEDEELIRKENV